MKTVRLLALAWAVAAMLAIGCSAGASTPNGNATGGAATSSPSRPPATSAPRPAGIPADASYVDADRTFGGVEASQPDAQPPVLTALACKNDTLTVVIAQVVELYAALPCDRAASQTVADLFIGRPVTVRVVVSDAEKLRLESATAGTLEFTVAGAWAKEAR